MSVDDESDKWMEQELEKIRIEFVERLEIIIEQYAKKKFGEIGELVSRQITVRIEIE